MPEKPFGHSFSPRGYLPIYSVVRMCGPNTIFSARKVYEWSYFSEFGIMNSPLFREWSISVSLKLLYFVKIIFTSKGRVIYYQVGGGRLYSGGGRNFFGWCTGGFENKNPLGQGGGVRYVPLVFAFIKSQSFRGAKPPRPPISKMILPTISNIKKKICK